jgi:hypothetical protein
MNHRWKYFEHKHEIATSRETTVLTLLSTAL